MVACGARFDILLDYMVVMGWLRRTCSPTTPPAAPSAGSPPRAGAFGAPAFRLPCL